MKFRIQNVNVFCFRSPNWENIFQFNQNNPVQYVGLFFFSDKFYLGGWINLPVDHLVEFDAIGYSIRKSGQLITLEIVVDSEKYLEQLTHLFITEQNDWLTKKEITKMPLILEFLEDLNKKANEFILETKNFLT